MLINFSKLPNKKFSENLYRGLSSDVHRHIHTNKHSEAKQHTVTPFHYKYAKKLLDPSWKCHQALFLVVEQLKYVLNLPNECSRKNFTQLANLYNIKVKQEFELIILDIKVIYVNIFINEPIKILALLIKKQHINSNKRPI